MAKSKFEITRAGVNDKEGNPIDVGTVVAVDTSDGKMPSWLIGKAVNVKDRPKPSGQAAEIAALQGKLDKANTTVSEQAAEIAALQKPEPSTRLTGQNGSSDDAAGASAA